MAKQFDTNQDGKLSKQEFSKFFKKLLLIMTDQDSEYVKYKPKEKQIEVVICKDLAVNMKVLLLGLDSSGKSTIYRNLTGDIYEGHGIQSTREINSVNLKHENMIYKLIDVGGAKRYRESWKALALEVNAVIYVIDSSDRLRINEAK